MSLHELLAANPLPKVVREARRQTRDALLRSGRRLVVIDDDPTGMQTVQDVRVFMDWSVDTLRRALAGPSPVFFVSVNSRSLNSTGAAALAAEVGRNLREAAGGDTGRVLLASRSDSTLRGHFPHEVDALCHGLGLEPDGVVLAPAFFEAGRFTVGDVHWAEQQGQLVPVHETEFARDPMFAFKSSNLKAWVEERTNGSVRAGSVRSISLGLVRSGGPDAVMQELLMASNAVPIVVNAAEYADLDVVATALGQAEDRGKRFVYRCSASFLKARGGFEDRALLAHEEMVPVEGAGLIVVGSYVDKTSRQLRRLLDRGLAEGIEVTVESMLDRARARKEVEWISRLVDERLAAGATAALYTTRQLWAPSGRDFADTGRLIIESVCEIVKRAKVRPAFIVAKGGNTSIQVARTALGVREAFALGQILPGVPVWRLGEESRWPGMAYVVFPGNVGDDAALMKAVETLAGVRSENGGRYG